MKVVLLILPLMTPSQYAKFIKGKPVILEMNRQEKEGGAKATILINRSKEKVFDVLCNAEEFPEFMPSVEKVEVLKKNGNSHIARFYVKKAFVEFDYALKRTCDKEKMEIRWVNADNKFKRIEGYWKLEGFGKGSTKVIYYTYLKPAFFIPQKIVNYMQKRSLPDMLNAVKKWIERGEGKRKKREIKRYDF